VHPRRTKGSFFGYDAMKKPLGATAIRIGAKAIVEVILIFRPVERKEQEEIEYG